MPVMSLRVDEKAMRRLERLAKRQKRDRSEVARELLADGWTLSVLRRFKQGKARPYAGGGGFGIGLYVVRSFVQLFGGTVTAKSHPEGGAEFTCIFREWTVVEGLKT